MPKGEFELRAPAARVWPAIGLAVVLAGALAPLALAANRPALSISPSKRIDERTYPDPLIGTISPSNPGAAVDGTPSGCDDPPPRNPYCDNIDFDIGAPAEIDISNSYAARVTLSFVASDPTSDLDLIVWQCTTPETRGGTCVRVAASRSPRNPEVVSFSDYPGGRFHITPQNVGGTNNGYQLKAEYIPGGYTFFNPLRKSGPPVPPGAATAPIPEPAEEAPAPGIDSGLELNVVKTPGADGPPTTTEIPTLATTGKKAADRLGPWGIVLIGVAVAALGGGAAIFIIRRRRLSEEAEA